MASELPILYLQECDLTLVSYLSDFEGSTDAILEQNCQYYQHSEGYHPLSDEKEAQWIQRQESSLLPPTLQVFSSTVTVSPPTSPLPSPPPTTSEHILQCHDSGTDMRESDAEEESPSSSSIRI